MKLRYLLCTAGLFTCIAGAALANATSAKEFVRSASIANRFEIESSKLALEKSKQEDIKRFAQQIIADHTQTGEKLETLLANSNIDAKPASKLDSKHSKLLKTLQTSKPEQFDERYIAMQKNAHIEAITLFSAYAKNGTDNELKNFADDTLPTLRRHNKHAEQLQDIAN